MACQMELVVAENTVIEYGKPRTVKVEQQGEAPTGFDWVRGAYDQGRDINADAPALDYEMHPGRVYDHLPVDRVWVSASGAGRAKLKRGTLLGYRCRSTESDRQTVSTLTELDEEVEQNSGRIVEVVQQLLQQGAESSRVCTCPRFTPWPPDGGPGAKPQHLGCMKCKGLFPRREKSRAFSASGVPDVGSGSNSRCEDPSIMSASAEGQSGEEEPPQKEPELEGVCEMGVQQQPVEEIEDDQDCWQCASPNKGGSHSRCGLCQQILCSQCQQAHLCRKRRHPVKVRTKGDLVEKERRLKELQKAREEAEPGGPRHIWEATQEHLYPEPNRR